MFNWQRLSKEEKLRYYICYLVARLKRKIKEAQNNKSHASRLEDHAYKMGYLMALNHLVEDMQLSTRDFNIEEEEIGVAYDYKDILTNFLFNLYFISEDNYQKRINFKEEKDYDGEFNQLNDLMIDQCEILHVLVKFEEKQEALLAKFYCHLEPLFQDYEGLDEFQRKESWKEIVDIAKEILKAFDFQKYPDLPTELEVGLSKKEYEYLAQTFFLPKMLKRMFFTQEQSCFVDKQTDDSYMIKIPPCWADEIRNLCTTQLQVNRFDKNYALTSEGKILESLVDKFFIG